MKEIPGRMEEIALGQPFTALVDFAHTPNALRVAINTIRRRTDKKLIIIYGSAGLRDKKKRLLMAEVAAELADMSILTAEDPRTEVLDEILAEMEIGFHNKGKAEGINYRIIRDRGEAIRFGVQAARLGDTLVVFGKGHEQSMCFGTVEYPWDDRTAMRASISELLGLPGPKMPYLPTQD